MPAAPHTYPPVGYITALSFETVMKNLIRNMFQGTISTSSLKIDSNQPAAVASSIDYTLHQISEPRPLAKVLTNVHKTEYPNSGTEAKTVEIETKRARLSNPTVGLKLSMIHGIDMGQNKRIGCAIFNNSVQNAGNNSCDDVAGKVTERFVIPPGKKIVYNVKTFLEKHEGELKPILMYMDQQPQTSNLSTSLKALHMVVGKHLPQGQSHMRTFSEDSPTSGNLEVL